MRRVLGDCCAGVLLALFTGLAPGVAGAAPPGANVVLVDTTVSLGRPARPARLRVTQGSRGATVAVGSARAELPVAGAASARVESLTLAGGATVAVVRVAAPDGEAAALLARDRRGRETIRWTGDLRLRGDPGERRADGIEIGDRTDDGATDVIVGRYVEGARVCGADRSLLAPRAMDPATLELRPVSLDRLRGTKAPVATLDATVSTPGPTSPPMLRSLRASGSSNDAAPDGVRGNASAAITDGDPRTFWIAAQGGGSRGEFVTLHADATGFPIRALALVLRPLDLVDGSRLARPASLALVGDGGERVQVRIPPEAHATPGQRVWLVPPTPLAWRCLSIVVDEASDATAPRSGFASLAEVEAYTDLDFGGGVAALVGELTSDGPRADDAVRLLVGLGPASVDALVAAWPRSTDHGRKRAIRVLAAFARTSPGARAALASALDDASATTRDAALDALIAAGSDGLAVLAPRIAQSDALGDRAVVALARHAPDAALTPTLAALAAPTGSERPVLREALSLVVRGAAPGSDARVVAWAAAPETPIAARAAAALALAHASAAGSNAASQILDATAPQAEAFADRWRLVAAARELSSSKAVDGWLATLAGHDERWMLRAAALDALHARNSPLAIAAGSAARLDPYPRVRSAALAALAAHPGNLDAIADRAERDPWAMVRIAALDAVALLPGAEPTLRAGVGDRRHAVRAAAVRGLRRARLRRAWSLVQAHLAVKTEWPDVASEGVAYVRDLCIREAGPDLLALVRRSLKPDAWEPDVRVAIEALEALAVLGGDAWRDARALAAGTAAPAGFRASAERAAATQVPACTPR